MRVQVKKIGQQITNAGSGYKTGEVVSLGAPSVTETTELLSSNPLNRKLVAATSIGDKIVAVGERGLVLVADVTKPQKWEFANQDVSRDFLEVVTLGNKFIAFCVSGAVLVSSNGFSWEEVTVFHNPVEHAVSNGSIICGITSMGECMYSVDGETWLVSTLSLGTKVEKAFMFGSDFITTFNNRYFKSQTGATWAEFTPSESLLAASYAKNKKILEAGFVKLDFTATDYTFKSNEHVLLLNTPVMKFSVPLGSDLFRVSKFEINKSSTFFASASTGEPLTAPLVSDMNVTSIASDGSLVLVATTTGNKYTTDGYNWATSNETGRVEYEEGTFRCYGSVIKQSDNGIEWTAEKINSSFVKMVSGSNNIQFALTNDGHVFYSNTLTGSWNAVNVGEYVNDIAVASTNVVYVGNNGFHAYASETNPEVITVGEKKTNEDFLAVCITLGGTVISGRNGTIFSKNKIFTVGDADYDRLVDSSVSASDLSVIAFSSTSSFAADGYGGLEQWSLITLQSPNTSAIYTDIANGGGVYYALSTSGLHTSSDGINWSLISSNIYDKLIEVNDKVIAVSGQNIRVIGETGDVPSNLPSVVAASYSNGLYILYSATGETSISQTMTTWMNMSTTSFSHIASEGNLVFALTESGIAFKSVNAGASWLLLGAVDGSIGVFIVDNTGYLYGKTKNIRSTYFPYNAVELRDNGFNAKSVVKRANSLVVLDESGSIRVVTDSTNTVVQNLAISFSSLASVGSTVYGVSGTYLYKSVDGITFTKVGTVAAGSKIVNKGSELYSFVGNILSSINLNTFASTNYITAKNQIISASAYGSNMLLGLSDGRIQVGNEVVNGSGYVINSLAYGNSVFVGVTSTDKIIQSTNGSKWTERGSCDNASTVKFVSGLFYITNPNEFTMTSADGVVWDTKTYKSVTVEKIGSTIISFGDYANAEINTNGDFVRNYYDPNLRIVYGNSAYVSIVGGKIAVSSDCLNWEQSDSSFTYTGVKYITGNASIPAGFYATTESYVVRHSSDGRTWASTPHKLTNVNNLIEEGNKYVFNESSNGKSYFPTGTYGSYVVFGDSNSGSLLSKTGPVSIIGNTVHAFGSKNFTKIANTWVISDSDEYAKSIVDGNGVEFRTDSTGTGLKVVTPTGNTYYTQQKFVGCDIRNGVATFVTSSGSLYAYENSAFVLKQNVPMGGRTVKDMVIVGDKAVLATNNGVTVVNMAGSISSNTTHNSGNTTGTVTVFKVRSGAVVNDIAYGKLHLYNGSNWNMMTSGTTTISGIVEFADGSFLYSDVYGSIVAMSSWDVISQTNFENEYNVYVGYAAKWTSVAYDISTNTAYLGSYNQQLVSITQDGVVTTIYDNPYGNYIFSSGSVGSGHAIVTSHDIPYPYSDVYTVKFKASGSSEYRTTWSSRLQTGPSKIKSIDFVDGELIILAKESIFKTTDGVNWTTLIVTETPDKVVKFNSTYYGLFGSSVKSSSDLITWVDANPNVAAGSNIQVVNGRFISGSGKQTITTDMASFKNVYFASAAPGVKSVAYANNIGVLVGSKTYTTKYGLSFVALDTEATTSNNVVVFNGKFYKQSGTSIKSSVDGVTWTQVHQTVDGVGKLILSGEFLLASVANNLYGTADGIDWYDLASGFEATNGYTVGATTYLTTTSGALASEDLFTWSPVNLGGTGVTVAIKAIVNTPRGIYAVAEGAVITSKDGMTWTQISAQTGLNDIHYDGSLVTAVGNAGKIVSFDANNNASTSTVGNADFFFIGRSTTKANVALTATKVYVKSGASWQVEKEITEGNLVAATKSSATGVIAGVNGLMLSDSYSDTFLTYTQGRVTFTPTKLTSGVTRVWATNGGDKVAFSSDGGLNWVTLGMSFGSASIATDTSASNFVVFGNGNATNVEYGNAVTTQVGTVTSAHAIGYPEFAISTSEGKILTYNYGWNVVYEAATPLYSVQYDVFKWYACGANNTIVINGATTLLGHVIDQSGFTAACTFGSKSYAFTNSGKVSYETELKYSVSDLPSNKVGISAAANKTTMYVLTADSLMETVDGVSYVEYPHTFTSPKGVKVVGDDVYVIHGDGVSKLVSGSFQVLVSGGSASFSNELAIAGGVSYRKVNGKWTSADSGFNKAVYYSDYITFSGKAGFVTRISRYSSNGQSVTIGDSDIVDMQIKGSQIYLLNKNGEIYQVSGNGSLSSFTLYTTLSEIAGYASGMLLSKNNSDVIAYGTNGKVYTYPSNPTPVTLPFKAVSGVVNSSNNFFIAGDLNIASNTGSQFVIIVPSKPANETIRNKYAYGIDGSNLVVRKLGSVVPLRKNVGFEIKANGIAFAGSKVVVVGTNAIKTFTHDEGFVDVTIPSGFTLGACYSSNDAVYFKRTDPTASTKLAVFKPETGITELRTAKSSHSIASDLTVAFDLSEINSNNGIVYLNGEGLFVVGSGVSRMNQKYVGCAVINNTIINYYVGVDSIVTKDGIVWQSDSSYKAPCINIKAITSDESRGVVVAVGSKDVIPEIKVNENPVIAYSTDGMLWTMVDNTLTEDLLGVTSGSYGLVAVGKKATIAMSENGYVWTRKKSSRINSIVDGFVAIDGVDGLVQYSTTGTVYMSGVLPNKQTGTKLVNANGMSFVLGDNGYIANTSLEETLTNSTATINGIAYGNDIYVAVGDGGEWLTSSDGVTFTRRLNNFTNKLTSVAFNKNTSEFVAVGSNGVLVTSRSTARNVSSLGTRDFNCITSFEANNASYLVAVGDGGVIYRKVNEDAWIECTSGVTTDINFVGKFDNWVVAVGDSGVVLCSNDHGYTWRKVTTGITTNLFGAHVSGPKLIVVGEDMLLATMTFNETSSGINLLSRVSSDFAGSIPDYSGATHNDDTGEYGITSTLGYMTSKNVFNWTFGKKTSDNRKFNFHDITVTCDSVAINKVTNTIGNIHGVITSVGSGGQITGLELNSYLSGSKWISSTPVAASAQPSDLVIGSTLVKTTSEGRVMSIDVSTGAVATINNVSPKAWEQNGYKVTSASDATVLVASKASESNIRRSGPTGPNVLGINRSRLITTGVFAGYNCISKFPLKVSVDAITPPTKFEVVKTANGVIEFSTFADYAKMNDTFLVTVGHTNTTTDEVKFFVKRDNVWYQLDSRYLDNVIDIDVATSAEVVVVKCIDGVYAYKVETHESTTYIANYGTEEKVIDATTYAFGDYQIKPLFVDIAPYSEIKVSADGTKVCLLAESHFQGIVDNNKSFGAHPVVFNLTGSVHTTFWEGVFDGVSNRNLLSSGFGVNFYSNDFAGYSFDITPDFKTIVVGKKSGRKTTLLGVTFTSGINTPNTRTFVSKEVDILSNTSLVINNYGTKVAMQMNTHLMHSEVRVYGLKDSYFTSSHSTNRKFALSMAFSRNNDKLYIGDSTYSASTAGVGGVFNHLWTIYSLDPAFKGENINTMTIEFKNGREVTKCPDVTFVGLGSTKSIHPYWPYFTTAGGGQYIDPANIKIDIKSFN